MTQHFIVIGNPIAHSQSPKIHQEFAAQSGVDICYSRQLCPDDYSSFTSVVEAFFHGGGVGANVTVPFKQMAYKLCCHHGAVSSHAKAAGAVNTLLMRHGQLFGDNTDGQGLVHHLQQLNWPLAGASVAIIGAGGAARGVILPLLEAGVSCLSVANRTVDKAERIITELEASYPIAASVKPNVSSIDTLTGDFDIIINATSIGLTGDNLPLSVALRTDHAYDMMYGRTLPFLQHFSQLGAKTSSGLGMLVAQAALSFEHWTGQRVDISKSLTKLTALTDSKS